MARNTLALLSVIATIVLWLVLFESGAAAGTAANGTQRAGFRSMPLTGSIDRAVVNAIAKPKRQLSIVGGVKAQADAWPWVVHVLIFQRGELLGSCGGSLIGARWVLTAAHCLTNDNGKMLNGLGVSAVLGTQNVGAGNARTKIKASQAFVNMGYKASSSRNDIAMIRLAKPAPQQALRMLAPGQESHAAPRVVATAIGWGVTRSGIPSDRLREVDLPLRSEWTCGNKGVLAFLFHAKSMICAGYDQGGKDTCQGDSGGPLMVSDEIGRLQVGIVSFGAGCAERGELGYYARVSSFTQRIVAFLAGDAVAPEGAPTAQTAPAVAVGDTAARVGLNVHPNGLATHYVVEYGATPELGSSAGGYLGAAGRVTRTADLTGLSAGTTYYYRVLAISSAGQAAGDVLTFTTAGEPVALPPGGETPATPPAAPPAQPPAAEAPTAEPLAGGRPEIRSRRVGVDWRGVTRVRLACPATSAVPCAGKIKLMARGRKLGSRKFFLEPGMRDNLRIGFSRRGLRLAEFLWSFRARVVVNTRDATGNRLTTERSVRVRLV